MSGSDQERKTRSTALSLMRKGFGFACIGLGVTGLVVLDQVDIVVNATSSLQARAFLLWEQPVLLHQGAVVAADMPALLRGTFGDHLFVKTIGGIPGDRVSKLEDGTPCIRSVCYPLAQNNGTAIGAALPAGTIPDGFYALVGDSPSSLDSRYAAIGLIRASDLRGRGWAIPWPIDWREHHE